jgi:hypothetical protein
MGYHDLADIGEQAESLQDLRIFMEETVFVGGTTVPKLDDLVEKNLSEACFIAIGPEMMVVAITQLTRLLCTIKQVIHGRFAFTTPSSVVEEVKCWRMAKQEGDKMPAPLLG